MKKTIRCLSCLLVCLLFLTACTGGTETPDSTTAPTTLPTTPPAPVFDEYDPDRPLPTLAAKFVSQDAADGNFIIAKDGEPVAKVVIPADCSIKVELAADDRSLLIRAEMALKKGDYARTAALLEACEDQAVPQWHYLRAEVAFEKKDYACAAEHYDYAQSIHPKECYQRLERCYEALGDYKRAYEYACKQR